MPREQTLDRDVAFREVPRSAPVAPALVTTDVDGDAARTRARRSSVMTSSEATTASPKLYYDPFDIEIDKDPHPLWRRMRDEAPLYRNEKYDFYALSRFDDVEKALVDWDTYRSGQGFDARDRSWPASRSRRG